MSKTNHSKDRKKYMNKNCEEKNRYETWGDAELGVKAYYQRVVISIDPVGPYKCDVHGCFHIGHQRPPEEIKIFNQMLRDIGYYRAA